MIFFQVLFGGFLKSQIFGEISDVFKVFLEAFLTTKHENRKKLGFVNKCHRFLATCKL